MAASSSKTKSKFDSIDFDRLANRLLEAFHVPSLSYGIVEDGKVLAKAFGLADIETNTPATPESLYYIGSVTKSFTGTAIAKYILSSENQQSKNKITLQTPLAKIVPEDFVLPDPWATKNVTFEDALSHRTGMGRHDMSYGGSVMDHKAVTRSLRHLPMVEEPRTKYLYCNTMYAAASHAIETHTNKPLHLLVRELILEPLGMQNTYDSKANADKHGKDAVRLGNAYRWVGPWQKPQGDGRFVKYEHVDTSPVLGAGYLISNALDMAKYAQAWLSKDENDTRLTQAVRDEVTKPRVFETYFWYEKDAYKHYGLGLSRRFYRGIEIMTHTGGVCGYTTYFGFIPSRQWGFIGLGNGDFAIDAHEIVMFHLVDNLLDIPAEERYDFETHNHRGIPPELTRRPFLDAVKSHFPSIPSPPLPRSLPLANYSGTYYHPSYRILRFSLNLDRGSYLESTSPDRTWPFILQLFHVSGEYWVCYRLRGLEEQQGQTIVDLPAMTRISVDGIVEAIGLGLEGGLVAGKERLEEGLIWFDRVKEEDD